jgi:hypothetical protein
MSCSHTLVNVRIVSRASQSSDSGRAGRRAIAEVAIEAVAPLPEELARLYLDVIIAALPAPLRQTLEARMQHYEYKSDFARRYYSHGRQEGLNEGRQAGLQAAAIALARKRLDALSDADVAAIRAATDADVLTELVTAWHRSLPGQGSHGIRPRTRSIAHQLDPAIGSDALAKNPAC